jgi:hypothetical protein
MPSLNLSLLCLLIPLFSFSLNGLPVAAAPPAISVAGDWLVRVGGGEVLIADKCVAVKAPVALAVAPAGEVSVIGEEYSALPLFNAGASVWAKGVRLLGVATGETSAQGSLVPDSVVVSSTPEGAQPYLHDKDYALDSDWGTLGRFAGGQIGEGAKVYISYRYSPARLDSIVVQRNGSVVLRPGKSQVNLPEAPAVTANELRLANLWIPGRLARLSIDSIFPILESAYPATAPTPEITERLLPGILRKLRTGEHLKILAWGDSVTDGGFLPSPDNRWQAQFVRRLKDRFPKANIELVTEAWPGRNTGSYLGEPPGALHNYAEKVLAAKPDLVISEFVNDAGLNPDQVEARYSRFLADFQNIGAEWIVLTPHYVMPSWMSLNREKDIDADPRPYVVGLRRFAAAHHVALADASLRWGRLWRQGIPYTTLLSNRINHPDPRGQKLFADSLMELFATGDPNFAG